MLESEILQSENGAKIDWKSQKGRWKAYVLAGPAKVCH